MKGKVIEERKGEGKGNGKGDRKEEGKAREINAKACS